MYLRLFSRTHEAQKHLGVVRWVVYHLASGGSARHVEPKARSLIYEYMKEVAFDWNKYTYKAQCVGPGALLRYIVSSI